MRFRRWMMIPGILPLLLLTHAIRAQETKPAAGVAAANPLAVDAGIEILKAGGSAVDAAVAVQAMLGLVEPQSSGLGGGAFLMHYSRRTGKITLLDGRETAPRGARPDQFLDSAGKPLPFSEAVVSGRAVGVPGVMPMLGEAHRRFGRLPWNDLFAPARRAADSGFVVPPRLGRFANGTSTQVSQPDIQRLFTLPDGSRIKPGVVHRNPAYAATLRQLAAEGPRALHRGDLARAIVARVRAEPRPGSMTLSDLERYAPVERRPLCRPFLKHTVCVPGPPSSGVAVLQMLGILEHTDIASRGPDDPQAWYLFAEASRLMYADRDEYVADPAFAHVPVQGLLDSAYIARRARLIGPRAATAYTAGEPPGLKRTPGDRTVEAAGTSHFVVIDRNGDVVSMTTTIESIFGSARVVGGFILNNELTDFSFVPTVAGRPVSNAVAGGKRPRSSMLPMIIFDEKGRFKAAIGSPGGSSILAYNAKTVVGYLAWNLPLQQAIDLPNLIARGRSFSGETGKMSKQVLDGLAAKGIVLRPGDGEDSGIHGLVMTPSGTLDGGADPRRDGTWRALDGAPGSKPPR